MLRRSETPAALAGFHSRNRVKTAASTPITISSRKKIPRIYPVHPSSHDRKYSATFISGLVSRLHKNTPYTVLLFRNSAADSAHSISSVQRSGKKMMSHIEASPFLCQIIPVLLPGAASSRQTAETAAAAGRIHVRPAAVNPNAFGRYPSHSPSVVSPKANPGRPGSVPAESSNSPPERLSPPGWSSA